MKKTVAAHGAALVHKLLEDFAGQSEPLDESATPDELHQLRIAGKKLRYTIEMFVDVLPKLKPGLSRLEALQKVLGDLHDADVALAQANELLASTPAERSARVFLLRRYAADRQAQLDAWVADFGVKARRKLVKSLRSATRL